ncbi:sulfite exporter TauE/SafE family protein [Halalkalibacterium halodurans]|uniref:sulfite exporter TauE/SafE family protein n=1 Tax=Halalkalibacterium halodurans TaxID=86665 RepID=UPI002E231CE0|nr:sulfite exporter TauE/SafE family protein [Halalkalibacterium halodurans]
MFAPTVSGGFFLVPMLISLLRFAPKKAVGTSLASVIFIVFAGFISYSVQTPVNFGLGLLLIIGTLIGSPMLTSLQKIYWGYLKFHGKNLKKNRIIMRFFQIKM